MSKKILITGASGFIGKFLTDEALMRNYNVYVAVRKTSNTRYFENKNVNVIEFDFSNSENIFNRFLTLPRFDYIIHNAGITKSLDSSTYFEVNLEYTKRIYNAVYDVHKTPQKFVYISSLAAIGPNHNLIATPITSYGKSKLAAEKYIIEKGLIPYIIIRPTAVYGPGEKDLFQSIKLISKGFNFKIGFKKQKLSFVYVKDLSKCVFDAIESPFANKEYFISDGNEYEPSDLGKVVAEKLHKKIFNITVPKWIAYIIAASNEYAAKFSKKAPPLNREKIAELSAEDWICNIEPTRTDLNYEASYNLEKGMEETIDWYVQEGWLK